MSAPFMKEIAECCRQLRLSANLAERSACTQGGSNQEYLYHLLNDEVEYRRKQRVAKLLKAAGFPAPYDFSVYSDPFGQAFYLRPDNGRIVSGQVHTLF